MRKILTIILSAVFLLCLTQSAFAYDINSDLKESFILDNSLYLIKETKAGEIKYFGERITITTAEGEPLDADDYIKTGDMLSYFGILDEMHIVVMGDTDCDGHITAADARLVLRMSAGLYYNLKFSERPDMKGAFDTNNSGLIEASDARDILRAAADIDNLNCFEEAIEKKYENAEKADYDDKIIMVCMNPDYVNNEEAYKPEFYGNLVSDVEKWITYSENHIWLKLYLKDPSKDNVDKLVEECNKNDAIIVTEKNYIFHLDTLD